MSKFDFKNLSDDELLNMEDKLDKEVSKSVLEAVYKKDLLDKMEQLEEVKKEKRRRKNNG
jgi:hypothetical protein